MFISKMKEKSGGLNTCKRCKHQGVGRCVSKCVGDGGRSVGSISSIYEHTVGEAVTPV